MYISLINRIKKENYVVVSVSSVWIRPFIILCREYVSVWIPFGKQKTSEYFMKYLIQKISTGKIIWSTRTKGANWDMYTRRPQNRPPEELTTSATLRRFSHLKDAKVSFRFKNALLYRILLIIKPELRSCVITTVAPSQHQRWGLDMKFCYRKQKQLFLHSTGYSRK